HGFDEVVELAVAHQLAPLEAPGWHGLHFCSDDSVFQDRHGLSPHSGISGTRRIVTQTFRSSIAPANDNGEKRGWRVISVRKSSQRLSGRPRKTSTILGSNWVPEHFSTSVR